MSAKSNEGQENICVVCFKNVEIYSIGSCDHMVCYECSTRMRVLCRQNECPICRQDLPKVVFTNIVKPFSQIVISSLLQDVKFKIYFQSKIIQDAFYKLLEHSCSICPNSPSFKTFQTLHDHMKKQHDLHYCDLCVEHLKIFSSERQCYTQKNLEQHKRKGDVDDRSHRGHPLCRFCDVRYMDNDCLYRHLRRDHLYCHFCDADGLDLYYSSYEYLREHFQTEHYLCEEGSCIDEKFTAVFRTDIDLRAHRASAHGRTLGKAAAKQARTLELEFTLKPRQRQLENLKKGRGGSICNASSVEGAFGGVPEQTARVNLPNLDSSEFPSLPSGSSPAPAALPQQHGRNTGLRVHAFGRRNGPLDMSEENFPVLGVANDGALPGTSVKLNSNSERSASNKIGAAKNSSNQVKSKANAEKNNKLKQDEFPCLTSSKKPQTSNPTPINWASISNKKPEPASVSTSTAQGKSKAPKLNGVDDFPCLNTKFNANLKLKANEPTKSNFVNVKTYKNNKEEVNKGKKTNSQVPVEVTEGTSSKAKSKKKKSKGNNMEEKSDTAKKKGGPKEAETKETEKSEDVQSSALSVPTASEMTLVKPLPKVEDWFGDLRKNVGTSQGEDDNLEELRNPSADVSFQSNNFSFPVDNGSSSSTVGNNNFNFKSLLKSSETKVPPGFDNFNGCFNNNELKKPPPGFAANFLPYNALELTANNDGQGFSVLSEFAYTPPVDFETRNKKLLSKVNKSIWHGANLDEFRKQSILFQQNLLTARQYYKHCETVMNEKGFQEVFPELLVLLPDIKKQQELFQVYSGSPIFSKTSKALDICVTCHQVIRTSDAKQHLLNHSLEQNFPSLKVNSWTK
ncbi:hypothetical protein RUM43_004685 [Polyplax serrata]|uniref:RING-type E3 ubiquitin transferase n=1 Tax=Polyplax serrata TaxID=468196 RepID=A0AAN8XQB9_POLSC